ncbi:uncharacterized protein LOC123549677 [Mercenaria mercenaria]|uniref:uncharacterized protein LOC123549677 n=1 Tax=Mercenaria mercenaria TaxID=6596 RepID=UPI00234E7D54|nr:uncharacterized protein LOC123549677 [Mercenaria mercenaria]XP_045193889.2 uncharacterized protein LOC123549677 [Mercenaria mercenaria]XP_053401053.1 uncharacterized protein LOC123549677 [Mercenaria mercenaria]
MSSGVSTYQCPSWEVYPRLHYFYGRYTDLLTRCKRVTGLLPKCFHNDRVISELDEIRDCFESGVRLNVIGTEISLNDLVFSTPEEYIAKGSPKVAVFICHTIVQNLDLEGLENINVLAKQLTEDFSLRSVNENVTIISCGIENKHSKEKIENFRSAIFATIQESGLTVKRKNILLGSEVNCLKSKTSEELEEKIVVGFHKINTYLDNFDVAGKDIPSDAINILETEMVRKAIHGFLRNPYNVREIECITGKEDIDKFVELAISRLSRVVKCAAVGPLAEKHNLQPWVCNELLHTIEFEEAICKSVSKNVRHHLKKLKDAGQTTDERKFNKFDFLLYPLQTDMKPVFERTEEKLSSMTRLSMIIRRLIFETNGYLKQTIVDSGHHSEKEIISRYISERLRRDILNLRGVYGLGTMYGKLEIHLSDTRKNSLPAEKQSASVPMKYQKVQSFDTTGHDQHRRKRTKKKQKASSGKHETPKEPNTHFRERKIDTDETETPPGVNEPLENIPELRSQIATLLQKHNFHHPYTVRYIQSEPKQMFFSFEPGNTLLGQTGPSECNIGTVGAYAESKDGKLYGLTSAHVVVGSRRAFIFKEGGKNPFSIHKYVVTGGQDECSLIDIAALQLIPVLQEEYKKSLESSHERVAKAELAMESPENLVGLFVHKYGSSTGLTHGVIMTVDYSKLGPKADDYIVIVDPLAGNTQNELQCFVGEFGSLLEPSQQGESSVRSNERTDTENRNNSCNLNLKRREFNIEQIVSTSETHDLDKDLSPNVSTVEKESVVDTVLKQNRSINTLREKDLNVKHPGSTKTCTSSLLYVRDINETNNALRQGSRSCRLSVFAEKGDSGSVICTRNLSHHGPKYLAVSMLSGGDFEIGGHVGKKSVSFMLKEGFKKLHAYHEIEF